MRNSPFWWIIIAIALLADLYVFYATRTLFQHARNRQVYTIVYWVVSVAALCTLLALPYLRLNEKRSAGGSMVLALILALFISKIVAMLFFAIDDIRRLLQWVALKFFTNNMSTTGAANVSRSAFLTWMGVIAGGGIFSSFVYGLNNKYKYQVKKIRLAFDNLPPAFKGCKLVHISDIHSGSFTNPDAVSKGIDTILQQKADVILFTGDLVNNTAAEMTATYQKIFSKLQAPMGVYATLGNHDYGDYYTWDNALAKQKNLEQLQSIHAAMGWKLLMDEHLPLQKGNATIGLIGVQNISGKGSFHSYGNLSKAMAGADAYPFTILMSHDPSHWDSEVTAKTTIDLTLSGHTHGMQFGVELPGFRWSPVQYMYKQWAGLYEKKHQKLYVNRGFGFIGYPGRVGILPEITVIELI